MDSYHLAFFFKKKKILVMISRQSPIRNCKLMGPIFLAFMKSYLLTNLNGTMPIFSNFHILIFLINTWKMLL